MSISSKKEQLVVNDFSLFVQALQSFSKLSNACKLVFTPDGFHIYGKNTYARGELTSNSVCSSNDNQEVSVCISDLSMLIKLLSSAMNTYSSASDISTQTSSKSTNKSKTDFTQIRLIVDQPFFRIESKKFKTKITTCKEDIIIDSISPEKIKSILEPVFEFTTTSEIIKSINSHSFIFPDIESARIYFTLEPEMEKNVLYATIGNYSHNLNNCVTLKAGNINFGNLDDRKVILNFDRLNLFNIVKSDNIKIQLMDKNVLVTDIKVENASNYYALKILSSILN